MFPDHLLEQLVRPGGQAQWPELALLLFRDVDAAHWRPSIAFTPKIVNDPVDFRQCHRVYGFRSWSPGHGTFVGIQLGVGPQVQVWVVELSVEILEWEFALAAFLDDIQHGCGCSHHEYLTCSEYRGHLRCFALCAAFPRSLVRRDAHDYYQRSVTISLA